MKRIYHPVLMLSIIFFAVSTATGQQAAKPEHANCRHHANKAQTSGDKDGQSHHFAEVNRRGDMAMGFSHEKTAHHFILATDGGVIDVSAVALADTESRDQIRMHLAHIEKMFANGNFSAPMLTHGKVPPGVPVMQKLKEQIIYKYEETERGGLLRISTANSEALQAIHGFLRFQIEDHQTGDSLEIQK